MTKPVKRHGASPPQDQETEDERAVRRTHSRHGSAVVVAHVGRRFAVVTDHRGVRHAREILEAGILAEEITDEDFEALLDAYPWAV